MSDALVERSNDGDVCKKGTPLQTLAGSFHQSEEFLIPVGSARDLSSLFLFVN